MYHQNTLKIFSHQYVGMFAVWGVILLWSGEGIFYDWRIWVAKKTRPGCMGGGPEVFRLRRMAERRACWWIRGEGDMLD